MSQRIFFNWQDDDSTRDLNRRFLGIILPGVYQGFTKAASGTATKLRLAHTTSSGREVDKTGVLSDPFGLIVTNQGATVRENGPIDLTISAGNTQPRIDVIYLEHEYLEVNGGTAAIYGVIQGTPGATPVAPALNSTFQVKIGELYVPANATDINNAAVIFTRVSAPDYLGDGTIMHTNKEQTSTRMKTFNLQKGVFKEAAINTLTSSIIINEPSNYFYIPASAATDKFTSINNIKTTASTYYAIGSAATITFYTEVGLLLVPDANILVPEFGRYIQPNSYFTMTDVTGFAPDVDGTNSVWLVSGGGEMHTYEAAKMGAALVGSYSPGNIDGAGAVKHSDSRGANTLKITIPNSGSIRYLSSFAFANHDKQDDLTVGPVEAGGIIRLDITAGTNAYIAIGSINGPTGTKPLNKASNIQEDILLPVGRTVVTLMELESFFLILDIVSASVLTDNPFLDPASVKLSAINQDDVFYADGANWVNKPFEGLVNRTRQFSTVQVFGNGATGTFFKLAPSNQYNLILPATGNRFVMDFSTMVAPNALGDSATIFDIKMGNNTTDFPIGSIITIQAIGVGTTIAGSSPRFGTNINTDFAGANDYSGPAATGTLANIGPGDVFTVMRRATNWVIVDHRNGVLRYVNNIESNLGYTYVKKALEAWKEVGVAAGSSFFLNHSSYVANRVKFRKDDFGRVQIIGAFTSTNGADGNVLTLPPTYRPMTDVTTQQSYSWVCPNNTNTDNVTVFIDPATGILSAYGGMYANVQVRLDVISYYTS